MTVGGLRPSGPPASGRGATVIERSELGQIGGVIGSGGQATVFRLPHLRLSDGAGDLVFKEFHPGQRPPAGLVSIIAKRQHLPTADRERLDRSAAWPLRVVRDGGQDVGVVLRLIPDAFFQARRLPGSGEHVRDLREIQNLFVDRALAARVGMPFPGPRQRLAICRDFAAALHFLHRQDFVVGDINARNAAFRIDEARQVVMLVDCDAVRIRGSAAVVAQLDAPDWDPPEGRGRLTHATDRYKFGLFVLRCLAPGAQASTDRDPARAAAALDPVGRALLARALSDEPDERPTMQEWGRYLRDRLAGRKTSPSPATAVLPQAPPLRRSSSGRSTGATTPAMRRNKLTGGWEAVR